MKVTKIFSLYYLSFLPLWLSIMFMDILNICKKDPFCRTEWSSLIAICLGLVISVLCLCWNLHREKKVEYTVTEIDENKSVTADYLLSNILPLFTFDFTVWHQVVLFLIFFLCLAFLHVRHNYFGTNVALELCKFSFFTCRLTTTEEPNKDFTATVISRKLSTAQNGKKIHTVVINKDFYFHVPSPPEA